MYKARPYNQAQLILHILPITKVKGKGLVETGGVLLVKLLLVHVCLSCWCTCVSPAGARVSMFMSTGKEDK